MRQVTAPRICLKGCSRITNAAVLLACIMSATVALGQSPPADFPHFTVPGHEPEMNALRRLFWKHYEHSGPVSTLWDEWIPGPTLWPAVSTEDRLAEIRDRWK